MTFSGPAASVGSPKVKPTAPRAVVANLAAPAMPDALATTTLLVRFGTAVVDGPAGRVVGVAGAPAPVEPVTSGIVMLGVDGLPASPVSLMLRRMMNPTTT